MTAPVTMMTPSDESTTYSDQQQSPLRVLVSVVEKEGAGALLAGLLPRAARAIASGAIQFASYEMTQNIMNRS